MPSSRSGSSLADCSFTSEYPPGHAQAEALRRVSEGTYQEPDPSTYDRKRIKRNKTSSRPNTAAESSSHQNDLSRDPRTAAAPGPPSASTSNRTVTGRLDDEIAELLMDPTPDSPALAPERASSGISRLPRPTVVVPSAPPPNPACYTHRDDTQTTVRSKRVDEEKK